jgi:hypothetical protein
MYTYYIYIQYSTTYLTYVSRAYRIQIHTRLPESDVNDAYFQAYLCETASKAYLMHIYPGPGSGIKKNVGINGV